MKIKWEDQGLSFHYRKPFSNLTTYSTRDLFPHSCFKIAGLGTNQGNLTIRSSSEMPLQRTERSRGDCIVQMTESNHKMPFNNSLLLKHIRIEQIINFPQLCLCASMFSCVCCSDYDHVLFNMKKGGRAGSQILKYRISVFHKDFDLSSVAHVPAIKSCFFVN